MRQPHVLWSTQIIRLSRDVSGREERLFWNSPSYSSYHSGKDPNMMHCLLICKSLDDALVATVTTRFSRYMKNQDSQLAAAFYPKFRFYCLRRLDNEQTFFIRTVMEGEVEEALRNYNIENKRRQKYRFFLFTSKTVNTKQMRNFL